MPELTLYHFEGCPYCSYVRNYMGQKGIKIEEKDTMRQRGAREELIKIGGKGTVPCLVIDGQALYESPDIVSWFKKNWK